MNRATWLLLGAALAMAGCRDGSSTRAATRPMNVAYLVVVTPQAATGGGLYDRALLAARAVAARHSIPVRAVQADPEKLDESLVGQADQPGGLVLLVGDDYLSAAGRLGSRSGELRVVCLGSQRPANGVETVWLRLDQPAYLCGLLAAPLTQTRQVLAMGDDQAALTRDALAAFERGVNNARSDVAVTVRSAPDSTSQMVTEVAKLAVQDGADVLFQVTSHPQAAFDVAGSAPNVFAFGSFADQSAMAPGVVVACAVVDFDKAIAQALDRAQAGAVPVSIECDLAGGFVSLAINPKLERLIPQATRDRVARDLDGIRAGTLDVQVSPATQVE